MLNLTDPIVSGLAVIGLGIIGYFLRGVHKQVDENGKAVILFKAEVNNRFEAVEHKIEIENKTTRAEIMAAFKELCSERQISCGRLRDAKLEAVQNTCKTQCRKIESMVDDRNKRWEKQEELNDLIKNHIAKE